ncbi:TatD family hydrolase [Segatella maculosa]|uniref:TatD family hydrolase n=1 Tax=Segatella maculosa OT 289 TaxID=999422 RepID=H1HLU3_9BACT|nr:TatD family hydrolase [Segatella maculosa]EHO71281.1 TatD family hydrolase [Segatella maculosa OT 289]
MTFTDTHTHLDGEEFKADLPDVIGRAKAQGVGRVLVPAIDLKSVDTVLAVCRQFPGYAFPMIGLHPEEVKADWETQLRQLKARFTEASFIAIGEVGLDFYWDRTFEREQLLAFEAQVEWAVETQLPLMIHCRKAQNELLHILKRYEKELSGGVFHSFTGNQKEAEQLLKFERFALGIGGVLTFKSSHLREDLPAVVPLERIVLETDSPYMAPVPHRGERNESAFVRLVLEKLAEVYGVSAEEVAQTTEENVRRIFTKI